MRADLLCGPGGNPRAGIDDPERLGIISALEAERLVVGAVNIDDVRTGADRAHRHGRSVAERGTTRLPQECPLPPSLRRNSCSFRSAPSCLSRSA